MHDRQNKGFDHLTEEFLVTNQFKCNHIGTRVCHCNGTWGPEPCQATIGQVEKLVCVFNRFLLPNYCLLLMLYSDF